MLRKSFILNIAILFHPIISTISFYAISLSPPHCVLFEKGKWSLVGFPVNLRSGDVVVSTLKVIATTLMDVVINFYYAADAKAHMINQLVSGYFS